MPSILAGLGSLLGSRALRLGFYLVLLMAVGGGGFAWGESHAVSAAATAAAKEANARVAAAQKSDQALMSNYLAKLSGQAARGNALAMALAADEKQLADQTRTAQERIAHVVPPNDACDFSAAAVALLRAQPARQ